MQRKRRRICGEPFTGSVVRKLRSTIRQCRYDRHDFDVTVGQCLMSDRNLACAVLIRHLVTWHSEPSQPQRITFGLNTNSTLSPSYSFHKSCYHKSCFFFFFSLFKFLGHSTREPASNRVTYFILWAYKGKKSGEVLEKCS